MISPRPLHPVRARLAWLGDAAKPDETLAKEFADAGYLVSRPRAPGGSRAVAQIGARRAKPAFDLAVVDVRESADPATDARRLLAQSGRPASVCGCVVLAPESADAAARAALSRLGDVCFPERDRALAVARDRLRLAALTEETGERLKTMAALHADFRLPELRTRRDPMSILVAGKPSRRALAAINAIQPAIADMVCVFSPAQALRALERRRFDCALFLPARRDDLLYALARALKRHRQYAALPVFASAGAERVLAQFAGLGCGVVSDDHLDEDLAARLSRAAERGRLIAGMRRFLRASAAAVQQAEDGDPAFFAHHSWRLMSRSEQTGRPLSLAGVLLEKSDERPEDDPRPDRVIDLCARITRTEDIALRLGPRAVTVLAPATTEQDAVKIAARAAGVIAGRLAARPKHPPRLAAADAVQWREGETPVELLGRLLVQLNAGPGDVRAATGSSAP